MPLVRIDLIEGTSQQYRRAVSEVVYETMVATLKVPENDRFQVITEHAAANFVFDPGYLGISRSAGCLFVQITLNEGRSVEVKRQFYAQLAEALHERTGLKPEDLFISLVEVPKENWSFGKGEAQYAPGR